ncbi:MAG: LegC family aminotransferase [Methylophilaceae bacterium]
MNPNNLIQDTVAAIRAVVGSQPVALHEPKFTGNEANYVNECIQTGWVSSVGKFVDKFEQGLAEYTGVKHAIAVVNGTAALHIALKLAGVERDDEVFVPTLTFIATANAISYCGAIPHFVDSSHKTLGLDPEKLEVYLRQATEVKSGECFNKRTGRRIKAVLPMHAFGHAVDLERLADICQTYYIELVEDTAESLGSFYKGKHTGHWGKVSALSFNGNKIITTGGGGAILTNDETLGKIAKHITTTAKIPHRWLFMHDEIGYNYRMPNLNAALGCAQLEQIESFLVSKRRLADNYKQAFSGVEGISFFSEPEFAKSNYWLNAILLDSSNAHLRDELLEQTNSQGIMTRPAWELMHTLRMYVMCPRMEDLSVAQDILKRLINIPSSVILGGAK